MKTKGMTDAQFLDLLQKVLPEATPNSDVAQAVFDRVAKEVRLMNSVKSFEKYCTVGSLPDLEPATVDQFREQLAGNFGAENVVVKPTEDGKSVAIEIALPDRTITNKIKVVPPGSEPEEEAKVPFVPFPVALPEDPELLWVFGRREDFPPEQAAIALAGIEEEFWETKAGQKLQRDRVEKSFAEFVQRVPAAALADHGLKRHYKMPEPLKVYRRLSAAESDQRRAKAEAKAEAKAKDE